MSNPDSTSRILALETSTEQCSVALLAGGSIVDCAQHAGQKHSEMLLPMIDDVLRQSGLRVRMLDAIAFGAGPGSFTGLRIACGVTQGLAFGADLPVVPVGSLEALAQACQAQRVVACADARMGQVYHAAYEREAEHWRVVQAPSLCDPDELPALEGSGWTACGSGFARYPQILTGQYKGVVEAMSDVMVPGARDVAVLAARYLAAGRSVSSDEAVPLYVRNKVALTMEEQK